MELQDEDFRRDGFFFDVQVFRCDLYRLLNSFFATAEYAKLSCKRETESLSLLAEEFQEFEITHLLVSIAATVRVIQDRDARHGAKSRASCGKYFVDADKKQSVPLTLREACNKIIHAERFNFDAKTLPVSERGLPNPTYTLRPFMHLGRYGSTNWKAELNVLQFVRGDAAFVQG